MRNTTFSAISKPQTVKMFVWGIIILIVLVLTLFGALNCNNDNEVGPPDEEPTNGTFAFTRDPETQPVVSSGKAGWPIFPTDPAVVKDEEGYHLFFTSYFCNANGAYHYSWDAGNLTACNIMDVVTTVGYAFSSDRGYMWEFRNSPVLLPGNEPWQRGEIETPHLAVMGDSLFLFYSATGEYQGQPFPHRYQIGVATLNLNGGTIRQRLLMDMAEFEMQADPLLPYNVSTTSFDNNTQEPSVVITNGTLEIFYVGVGLALPDKHPDAPGQSIVSVGMARAVFDSDLQIVEQSGGYILPDANITEVKYFDGAYHVFSTTLEDGEFHQNEKISYFQSINTNVWSEPEILLTPGAAFDNWGMMAPTVVVEDDEIVLFYTGWSIENHTCFPEPLSPDVRFGRPTDNNSKCIYGSIGRAVSPRLTND